MAWRLAFSGEATSRPDFRVEVALSGGSSVVDSNVALASSVDLRRALGEGDEDLVGRVRQKWGAVTSFSNTEGANRISLRVPLGADDRSGLDDENWLLNCDVL